MFATIIPLGANTCVLYVNADVPPETIVFIVSIPFVVKIAFESVTAIEKAGLTVSVCTTEFFVLGVVSVTPMQYEFVVVGETERVFVELPSPVCVAKTLLESPAQVLVDAPEYHIALKGCAPPVHEADSVKDCPESSVAGRFVMLGVPKLLLTVTIPATELTVTGLKAESVTVTQNEFVVVGEIINEFTVPATPA